MWVYISVVLLARPNSCWTYRKSVPFSNGASQRNDEGCAPSNKNSPLPAPQAAEISPGYCAPNTTRNPDPQITRTPDGISLHIVLTIKTTSSKIKCICPFPLTPLHKQLHPDCMHISLAQIDQLTHPQSSLVYNPPH